MMTMMKADSTLATVAVAEAVTVTEHTRMN